MQLEPLYLQGRTIKELGWVHRDRRQGQKRREKAHLQRETCPDLRQSQVEFPWEGVKAKEEDSIYFLPKSATIFACDVTG